MILKATCYTIEKPEAKGHEVFCSHFVNGRVQAVCVYLVSWDQISWLSETLANQEGYLRDEVKLGQGGATEEKKTLEQEFLLLFKYYLSGCTGS